MFYYNEVVRSGNNTARIKNFYEANNLIVLMDISGEFKTGDTIVGDDSGYSYTFTNFNKSVEYDIAFDPTLWDANGTLSQNLITTDDGNAVVLDAFFGNTTASRNYNPTYVVTLT